VPSLFHSTVSSDDAAASAPAYMPYLAAKISPSPVIVTQTNNNIERPVIPEFTDAAIEQVKTSVNSHALLVHKQICDLSAYLASAYLSAKQRQGFNEQLLSLSESLAIINKSRKEMQITYESKKETDASPVKITIPPVSSSLAPPFPSSVSEKVKFVPRELTMFQWVGQVDSNAQGEVFDDVEACLARFEDILEAYGMDRDRSYVRLIKYRLPKEVRKWYADEFLAGDKTCERPYAEFSAALIKKYGPDQDEDRTEAANALYVVSMNHNEKIDKFVGRFNDLRRRAGKQVPADALLISYFARALPPDVVNST
jgi:hypothetical protein